MSFYRIYRPQVLADIDNASVRERLTSFLHKDRSELPHAFIFSGPKGTGKTTAGRIIAKLFNCEKLSKKDGPCGTCGQCTSIARGNNLDVLEMDAASNRGIEDIRALREQIALSPVSAGYKVYIIDEVHMLTTEAFNALLKTLEEPPKHAVFILATTDSHKVPATILSRCVPIVFAQASADELTHALSRIIRKEKIDIDKEAIAKIAQAADGSFRDATKLLEQVSFHRGKVTLNVLHKMLSLSEHSLRQNLFAYLAERDTKKSLAVVGTLVQNGYNMRAFVTECLEEFSAMLVSHVMGTGTPGWDEQRIMAAIRKFSEAHSMLRTTPIPQLPLELAIVELCTVTVPGDTGNVIRGEEKKEKDRPEVAPAESKSVDTEIEKEDTDTATGLLTLEKLSDHWPDFIASLKSYNHSVAGVLRSARPKAVRNGIVTIEAFYKFHAEKLGETKTREVLAQTLKKLFGEKVKVEVVLGKKD